MKRALSRDRDRMSEIQKPEERKLSLKKPGKLESRKTVETGQVRQSFSHGRSKTVTVEVKRKRSVSRTPSIRPIEPPREVEPVEPVVEHPTPEAEESTLPEVKIENPDVLQEADEPPVRGRIMLRELTEDEKQARAKALEGARQADLEAREQAKAVEDQRHEEEQRLAAELEAATKRAEIEEERKREEEETRRKAEAQAAERLSESTSQAEPDEPEASRSRRPSRPAPRPLTRRGQPRRRGGKLTVARALDETERVRSLASVRRAREREKRAATEAQDAPSKVVREVTIPESIAVQDLANRMAERGVDVIKSLMNMGVMATINQAIDGDTAELVVAEFGHKVKRVSAADVEIGLKGEEDKDDALVIRAPVVTIMGHVDHGKTSLLDAIRETDVASGERGGITQHIGAYQIETVAGSRITFLDTPGHEAFTAMRARGAHVTDLVVLVVAADDGIMPQTVEAIDHAKAAAVPIIVAINKMDKSNADAGRVRQELLNHELVAEELGGDILCVEVSAKEKTNLERLEEAILLQAELLELKANPNRGAEGLVIEAKLDRGRGPVATVLVQRGSLSVGDIVVVGSEWGRVRALVDDRGHSLISAGPAMPIELLGLNGVPEAGDEFVIADTESRARQVTDFRKQSARDAIASARGQSTLDQMFSKIEEGEAKELPVVIKADVHGSLEAIEAALGAFANEEVMVRVLHAGVGGINESDVVLARASNALVIGFNIRADAKAREIAKRDKVDISYYSVIYELTDDVKGMLSGMLSPDLKERFLGNAEILEIFNVGKIGKVAGCRVTEGTIRRGSQVRLLRDNAVVYEGKLGTLRRFKDDVREVRDGTECGIGIENFQDVQVGDVVESFEVEKLARTL